MINRRQFGAGVGALSLIGISRGEAAEKTSFRFVNPNGAIDATQCWSTCGADPRLGYYDIEGVKREQFTVTNLNQGMMAIVQGQADAGTVLPALYLPALAKEPNLGVIGVYNLLPRDPAKVIVPRGSEIKSVADLAGKRIGARSLADGGDTTIKILFADAGIPESTFQLIAVGDVGMAGNALERKSVDAFVGYDTIVGRIETLGFPIRYLPMTKSFEGGAAAWYAVRKDALKNNRKSLIGVLRGTAKSTLFAYYNLPAAIKLHWAVYPESKPKAKSEEEAVHDMQIVLKNRREAWVHAANDPEQRMGATSLDDWSAAKRTASMTSNNSALGEQLGNPDEVYTNELIAEVNDFDRAAIAKQAREFSI